MSEPITGRWRDDAALPYFPPQRPEPPGLPDGATICIKCPGEPGTFVRIVGSEPTEHGRTYTVEPVEEES